MKKKRKSITFEVNIWDFIDIDSLNTYLDTLVDDCFPVDIGYVFKKINKHGWVRIKADFEREEK